MIKKFTFLVVGVMLTVALALAAYQLYARRTAPAEVPAAGAQRPPMDLRQLMQSELHEDYTRISFTIWHDKSLTPEKMDVVAFSSARVVEVARGLDVYEPGYQQQGWSAQDIRLFDDKRLQLVRVAEELTRAARKRDGTQVVNFFMHMDATCQSCHKRFRPDMTWN